MKKFIPFIILALLPASSTKADLVSGPEVSFLWNQFNSVTVLDTFALATSDFGVALLRLNPETGLFDTDTTVLLSNQAISIKVAGDLAVVRTTAGIACLFDLSLLPQISLIGEIDIGTTIHDVVLVDSDLYFACGFQGLRHYALVGSNSFEFVDSSLAPVHCVQVESEGPHLIVLDDYNGLLRYQPGSAGIGPVQSTILVPRRVDAFFVHGDSTIMSLVGRPLVYRASFGPVAGPLDSIPFSVTPDCVFVIDTLVVALDLEYGFLETVSTVTGKKTLASIESDLDLTVYGDTYHCGDDPCLLLVSQSRGLLSFNLANLWYDSSPRMAYARPGPIRALTFHKGRLATGGLRNPLELFNVDLQHQPMFDTSYFNVTQVGVAADGGEVLFSYSSSSGMISSTRFLADSISTVSTLPSFSLPVHKLVFHENPMSDGAYMLLALGDETFDLISVSQSGRLSRRYPGGTFRTTGHVLDAIVDDTVLLVSTTDRQLYRYKINSSSSIMLEWTVSTPTQFDHMVVTGPRGVPGGWSHYSLNLAFSGPLMYQIYFRPDGMPRSYLCSTLPVEVTNSALGHNALYTIGPTSCGFMDLSYEIPKMTSFGGYGGNLIAVHDSVLATSDGTAIHLYQLPAASTPTGVTEDEIISIQPEGFLHPNYPNPFNPQTIIGFDLPRTMHVELAVYDVLGRRVASLLNRELPPGEHSVEWRGIDDAGGKVASGVYFYRLTADGTSETRKMVHLK
jgi:hypothetical protein